MSATDMDGCRSLLQSAEKHRVRVEAIAKATGDNFNIFNILGIDHYEVKTHSPILGELLNPEGRHGQGSLFLRLFLKCLKIDNFDADSAEVRQEYPISPGADGPGGRIDILLRDGDRRAIIIENKIHAGDGLNQLACYRAHFPDAELFYLTLDGRKPSEHSGGAKASVKCISYATDILEWLGDCHRAAVRLPAVREIIHQYIRLIEELTNRGNRNMNGDLVKEITGSQQNLAAFFAVKDEAQDVYGELIARAELQLKQLATKHGLQAEAGLGEAGGGGCYFRKPGLENHNLRIGFEFDKGDFRAFFYGLAKIHFEKPCPCEEGKELLLVKFRETFGSPSAKHANNWPAYALWDDPYRYWGPEAWEGVRSGDFVKLVEEKLIKLISVAEKVCSAFPPAPASREESCDSPAPGDLQIAPAPQSNNGRGRLIRASIHEAELRLAV